MRRHGRTILAGIERQWARKTVRDGNGKTTQQLQFIPWYRDLFTFL